MRIVLIEDRAERLERFSACDFSSYPFLQVATGGKFEECKNQLEENADAFLEHFDAILSHRSAFSNDLRESIKAHCKKTGKPLLFFSGGISTGIFSSYGFPFLHINAKEFYSPNLCLFLDCIKDAGHINLMYLQFGKQWQLNALLNLRNHLAVGANNKTLKRVGDLQINALIKPLLLQEKELSWLEANEYANLQEEKSQAENRSSLSALSSIKTIRIFKYKRLKGA